MLESKSRTHDKAIVTLTVSLLVFVFALGMVSLVSSKKPENVGKGYNAKDEILNLEISWDEKGTKTASSFDWGSLEPGTEKAITIYIKNKEKSQVTLDYVISNWDNPENSNFLHLTWDYDGHQIGFKETIKVTFILTADQNASERDFSFNITIIANQ